VTAALLRLRVLFCVLIPVGSTTGDKLDLGDEESRLSSIVGGSVDGEVSTQESDSPPW
jgi:hypothetical protein